MFQYIQLKNNILKVEGEILCLEKKRKDEGLMCHFDHNEQKQRL